MEITNLNVKLQNNPYAGYIIPLIEYFNDPVIVSNPFEALAVAGLIKERSLNWGNGNGPVQGIAYLKCCCPELTYSGSNCSWIKFTGAESCPPCQDSNTSTARTAPTSLKNIIIESAALVGIPNPYTPPVNNFMMQMHTMAMDIPNAWIYFNQMIDEFYANVQFVPYFLNNYQDGLYAGVFQDIIGGTVRPGVNTDGLLVTTRTDGEAGATKARTTITVDIALAGDTDKYWVMYSDSTNRWIIWFDVDGSGSGGPVLIPIGGITDHYIKVDLLTAETPADAATSVANQLALAVGWAFAIPTTGGVSDVIIDHLVTGPQQASEFGNLPAHDTWAGAFVDGTSGVATQEVTQISYAAAVEGKLPGRWFKMYNGEGAGSEHLFYYQVAGRDIDPATLNTSFDVAHAINLSDRPSATTASNVAVQLATSAVVLGTGLWESASGAAKEKCCECNGRDAFGEPIPGCCGPCDAYATVASIPSTDSDGGTAAIGDANVLTTLTAPNGTVFPGVYQTDREWVVGWNTIVVPYMKSIGQPTHYLASRIIYPCICCIQNVDCPGGCIFIDCPDADISTARRMSLMQQTTFQSNVEDIPFNRPAGRNIDIKDVCPSCLM